jgi:hypothetical protein
VLPAQAGANLALGGTQTASPEFAAGKAKRRHPTKIGRGHPGKTSRVTQTLSCRSNGPRWRSLAFLGATNDGNGTKSMLLTELGLALGMTVWAALLPTTHPSFSILARPTPTRSASMIFRINDLPNEDGVPNHDALQSGSTSNQDYHDILTGTNSQAGLCGQAATCNDWTSAEGSASQKPRCGHS